MCVGYGVKVFMLLCGSVRVTMSRYACRFGCEGVQVTVWRCVCYGVEVCRLRDGGVQVTVWRCVGYDVEVCMILCGSVQVTGWKFAG